MQIKRALLKISGEALAGENPDKAGFDTEFITWLCQEIKKAIDKLGVEVAIVVGGGNFIRGSDFGDDTNIKETTAHYMGMLSTMINGQALHDTLDSVGQDVRVMSALQINQVAEPFIMRRAIRHMQKGRVVILSGGIGKPYMTTDTAAVAYALELDCDVVLKATKVDGVFDKDPEKHSDAQQSPEMSYQEALEKPEIKVMDKGALGMAMDNNIPTIVFNLFKEDNILNVLAGEHVGTRIN